MDRSIGALQKSAISNVGPINPGDSEIVEVSIIRGEEA